MGGRSQRKKRIRGILFSEGWNMSGTYSIPNGWADSSPKGVAQLLRAGIPARTGGVVVWFVYEDNWWLVACVAASSGKLQLQMYSPLHPHRTEYVSIIFPLVCTGWVLSVVHRVSPQFGYSLLIVALPYSFICHARLLLFLFCWRHCS